MNPSRRKFLQQSLFAAGSLAFAAHAARAAAGPGPHPGAHDEAYWEKVRAQFPLTSKRVFLNNGTIGVSPYKVIDSVYEDMLDCDTFGWHGGGEQEALSALASFLGTKEEEISLTHNVTEGINIVCWGLPLAAGDEVIITNHEHVGHAGPWLNRRKLSGVSLVVVDLGKTAEETLHNISKAISAKTRLISVPHIPCTIGQVLPVKEICSLARQRGIWTCLDGAHPPGMLRIDLHDIGCDFYAGCCHKWMLGPKGTGFLYVAEDKRNVLQAYYGGAGVDTGWDLTTNPFLFKGYAESGHRYFYGTQNSSLYQGIARAVAFQEEIGRQAIEERVKALSGYLQDQLIRLHPDMDMLTPQEQISRAAQVSFRVKGRDMQKFQARCQEKEIIIRYVPENNIHCIRVSTHIYNTYAELDYFLSEVEQFVFS
ncbi:MAG: aminotransferase class V-fold PLP-dependent enzyme [Chitinophagaceae bacterium]|nr:aminotransferase class V-fold PLP-dependent enzyme [Chitinophagaceae bacterium]